MTERLKIQQNDETDILKIKGSNSAYITNDNLHYISPLKVSGCSVYLDVSLTFFEIKETIAFSKKVHNFLDTVIITLSSPEVIYWFTCATLNSKAMKQNSIVTDTTQFWS